jgi:sugar O-acyltransferase (sialic acid O-acetyltransferase NeuD family)
MKYAIIGNGGHAREIIAQLELSENEYVIFVEDEYLNKNKPWVHGISEFDPKQYTVIVAIGDPAVRRRIVESVMPESTVYGTLVHHTARLIGHPYIGSGCMICAGAVVMPGACVNEHSIISVNVTVSHDALVGEFSTVCPGANIAGFARIGPEAFVGANATVIDHVSVCRDVVIGAGACVVEDITEPGTYVGVPAKIIK